MDDDFSFFVDYDNTIVTSNSGGFHFFVPRRLALKFCRPLLERPDLQIVASDVWKLKSVDE